MVTGSEHGTFVVIVSVTIVGLTLTSLSMALRMFTRIVVLKRTGWEDWILCVAFFLYLATLALFPKCMSLGLLKPVTKITLENGIALGKLSLVGESLYPPCMALIKLSILLQMIRIFIPIHQTKSFYFIVAFAVLNTMWLIGIFFVTIFQCTPVSRVWNPTIRGHCLNYSTWIFAVGAVNMVSDCVMLVLPLFWISRLQMDLKRKLTAGAVFFVGLLACASSVVRFVFSNEHFRSTTSRAGVSSLITVALCTSGEMAAGIITANLPNIPAFVKYFKAEIRTSQRGYSEESSDSDRLRREFDRSKLDGLAIGKTPPFPLVKEGSRTPSTRNSDEKETEPVNSSSFNTLPDLVFRTE